MTVAVTRRAQSAQVLPEVPVTLLVTPQAVSIARSQAALATRRERITASLQDGKPRPWDHSCGRLPRFRNSIDLKLLR
jgi:hypothetical protein